MTLATLGASGSPGSHKPFMPMLPKWPHIRQYSDFDRPEGVSREEWGVECAKALETAIHYEGAQSVAAFLATPHGCGPDYAVVPPKPIGKQYERFAIVTMCFLSRMKL